MKRKFIESGIVLVGLVVAGSPGFAIAGSVAVSGGSETASGTCTSSTDNHGNPTAGAGGTVGSGTAATACGPTDDGLPGNYQAIAYSLASGQYGTSWDFPTKLAAEDRAIAQCGAADCQVYVWARNACTALAISYDGSAYGWGWAAGLADANFRAQFSCQSAGGWQCNIRAYSCP